MGQDKFIYNNESGLNKLNEEEYLNLFTKEETGQDSKEDKNDTE